MAPISEGEVAVYDRQLRLWGVQAQQRLLQSKVLIWGLEGSSVEVCKNLVLAGVSITIRDHRAVSEADVAFNCFLRPEDVGKNRAECSSHRLQEMNPLSKIVSSSEARQPAGELKEALKEFHVVICSLGVLGWDISYACSIDSCCRELNSGFLLSIGAGQLAAFFTDLGAQHVVQEKTAAQTGSAGTSAPPPERSSAETVQFPSLQEFLDCEVSQLRADKVDPSVVLMLGFVKFLAKIGDPKQPGAAAKFKDFCGNEVAQVDGVPEAEQLFSHFLVEPLVPVAAIVGGLMSQEVIKAITKRDHPLVNCVCFNSHTSAAFVERVPPERAAKKQRTAPAEDTVDLD